MIIQELDGTQYDIVDYGLDRLYHNIPSAEIEYKKFDVTGRGSIVVGHTIKQRTIKVDFIMQVRSIYSYYLLRDKLNALFLRGDPFYIIFKREPYTKWLVHLDKGYQIPPVRQAGHFELTFTTVGKYGESIYTTQQMVMNWSSGFHGWNGIIDWTTTPQYTFNTSSFTVKNRGNAPVDPVENYLKITVKGAFTNYFQMTNLTNGIVYRLNESLSSSDTLVLEKVSSLKNGVSVYGKTNHNLMFLEPGDNQFLIEGGTVTSIAFDFNFLIK